MDTTWIVQWYNLFFAMVAGIAFLVFILMAAFGIEHDWAGHFGHHDFGHDVGGGHDVHAHVGHDHGTSDNSFVRALSILGIGRAPLSIVMFTFFLLFGVIGMMSNMVCQKMFLPPLLFFTISLIVAFLCGGFITGRIATVIGRFMPTFESYQVTRQDLVGKTGQTVYQVNPESGTIHVYDDRKILHQLNARSTKGEIAAGREVILEQYVAGEDYFVVSESGLA